MEGEEIQIVDNEDSHHVKFKMPHDYAVDFLIILSDGNFLHLLTISLTDRGAEREGHV